ncbi:MAG: hypothetical protein OXG37_14005 [Actinomycetia bacterium]|nr:hypothetical protein [Actinomycetes bacterium]
MPFDRDLDRAERIALRWLVQQAHCDAQASSDGSMFDPRACMYVNECEMLFHEAAGILRKQPADDLDKLERAEPETLANTVSELIDLYEIVDATMYR